MQLRAGLPLAGMSLHLKQARSGALQLDALDAQYKSVQ
jgi:hypothetical protein